MRKQLAAPTGARSCRSASATARRTWTCIICTEGDKATGLAVIASEPREFTIVNIIGSIDIDKIGQLEGQFGIPELDQNP